MIFYVFLFPAIIIGCKDSRNITGVEHMEDLIRLGYDHTDESCFPSICKLLNDSIRKEQFHLIMFGGSSINEIDSTVDWYFNFSKGKSVYRDFDLFYCTMDLKKNYKLTVNGSLISLNDIQPYINQCLFKPDSTYWDLIAREVSIPGFCDMELSGKIFMLNVNAKDDFTLSDWNYFFLCLHNVIESYEKEQNRMALKLWELDYNSLSFNEKVILTEVIPFSFNIRFY